VLTRLAVFQGLSHIQIDNLVRLDRRRSPDTQSGKSQFADLQASNSFFLPQLPRASASRAIRAASIEMLCSGRRLGVPPDRDKASVCAAAAAHGPIEMAWNGRHARW